MLRRLASLLHFDARKDKPAGLHLRAAMPELNLPYGARLSDMFFIFHIVNYIAILLKIANICGNTQVG